MDTSAPTGVGGNMQDSELPVAVRLAEFALATQSGNLPAKVLEKARACLTDFLACALEARNTPWGKQSLSYGTIAPAGPCGVVGNRMKLGAGEAAFVNGALGHGLVREDMHVASCTHLGVVVWPALLALAEMDGAEGDDFLTCGAIGYEVGARVGRALFDAQLQSRIRPTGTVGAIGAAAAGARLLGLDRQQTVAALGLAANMACGLNEWPWAGGHEMVFHAATAARNAVTAVLLARTGVFASPTAIDGRAGLFAAYDRRDRAASIAPLGDGKWEIEAVYFKPAPACNYVQTPCQAALAVFEQGARADEIEAVHLDSFSAALDYPGCNHAGPYPGLFEAKMSLQYSIAAVLVAGAIGESNYRLLDDHAVMRLAGIMTLSVDPEFESAYPDRQGARIRVRLRDGKEFKARLDDVRSLDGEAVRQRFAEIAAAEIGPGAADRTLRAIDALGQGGRPAAIVAACTGEAGEGQPA
jgi:2-methylcitrate dehydratase PrpD